MGTGLRKVVLAGGSGALGRALGRYLAGRGYVVVVLSRGGAGGARDAEGVRVCRWDGRSLGEWVWELEGAAAVVNLAGRSVNCRYSAGNRREIMESRVVSTRVLGAAIAGCVRPPAVWINSSTATIYRHTLEEAWDEMGEIGATREAKDSFSVEVARDWESAFFDERPRGRTGAGHGSEYSPVAPAPHGGPSGVRKVAMRTAIVLSNQRGTMVPILRRLVAMGLGGRMGSGRQYVSWIHERDFCRAVEFLIAREDMSGVVNVAAPNPVTNGEMMGIFREVKGRKLGLPAARWMLEVGAFFLRTETELVLKSRRVVPGRLVRAGFRFEFEQMERAVRALAGNDECSMTNDESKLNAPMFN